MIIESAFLKLPELLTSSFDHRDTFEATVVHLFATAILMEFDSRNVPRYFDCVFKEKPFPSLDLDGKPIHADLFVNLEGAVPSGGRLASYGTRQENWVEVKAFLSSTRKRSPPPKTENIGKIIRDFLRLCVLPEEMQGPNRTIGRYFLIVLSNPPSESLALQNREWLRNAFSDGDTTLPLNTSSLI